MMHSKRTAELTSAMERVGGREAIDVVVELRHNEKSPAARSSGMTRAERLAARQRHFEADASQVIDRVRAAGGAVTAAVWLNDVLYVTIDPAAIDDLESIDVVRVLDVPHDVTLMG